MALKIDLTAPQFRPNLERTYDAHSGYGIGDWLVDQAADAYVGACNWEDEFFSACTESEEEPEEFIEERKLYGDCNDNDN